MGLETSCLFQPLNFHSYLYPSSVAIVYDYSSLNRLTNMSVVHGLSTIANYAYTLLASGHRIGATETLNATTLNRRFGAQGKAGRITG